MWRYVTHEKGTPSEHRGHTLLEKDDLTRMKYLPDNYAVDENGSGVEIDFPIKAKPVLSWSPNERNQWEIHIGKKIST